MTNFINFTKNGITTLINTLPYLPLVFLIIGFIGWALFMVVPTIWRLHNAAYFTFIDNLPFIFIALAILGAGHLALLSKAYLKLTLFTVVPFIIFGWY